MSGHVVLGCESLAPGRGGICRVARLVARVLAEKQETGELVAHAIALTDRAPPADLGVRRCAVGGSRARFVLKIQQAALRPSSFIYDFLGMARAHAGVPTWLRRRFLTFIHGIEIWEAARRDRLDWARRADCLIANSQYTRERAARLHGGFESARVCWLGTESDHPAPRSAHSGPPTVTIIGRVEPGRDKGHEALLRSWPAIRSAVPDAQLLVVGTGSGLPALKRLAGVCADSIDFVGFVPDEDIERIWRRTDVFAMPSIGEGFGLVYVEAMRHAVPVIASIHDAASEINLDGVTGLNVDLGRPGELAEKLSYLLRNPTHRERLGSNGLARWHEHFRFSAFKERFSRILDEFLQGESEHG